MRFTSQSHLTLSYFFIISLINIESVLLHSVYQSLLLLTVFWVNLSEIHRQGEKCSVISCQRNFYLQSLAQFRISGMFIFHV